MRHSPQSMLSTAASVAASVMVVRTIARDLFPDELRHLLFSSLGRIFRRFFSHFTVIIDEFDGLSINKLYSAAQLYLGSKISTSTTRCLRVFKDDNDEDFTISMERGETVVDVFQGVKLEWKFVRSEKQKNPLPSCDAYGAIVHQSRSSHSFSLTFHKKHKDVVLRSYLPHLLIQAKAMADKKRTLKLHTIDSETRMYGSRGSPWKSVNLNHPATFSTVAMDAGAKEAVMEDLERFVKRKEFYRRVGKAWKRGYLLYGPPGTGKSSLIAAMANFLNFDVYDLELTDVGGNFDLRRILIGTANRSILVIEDIDCTLDFKVRNEAADDQPDLELMRMRQQIQIFNERNKITLSGLLNFIDGLWSSCGHERIIVFTTNHKEKLDPALLRPGRMDMHIHMSYCTFFGFKTLAKNYLEIPEDHHHPSFQQIEPLMKEVEVTPAQVAEELMKSNDPNLAFGGFVEFLKRKKVEGEEKKAKSKEEFVNEEKPQVENALVLSISGARMATN